jgi:hypothetical protein
VTPYLVLSFVDEFEASPDPRERWNCPHKNG